MASIRDRVKQLVPTQVTTRVKESLVDYGVRTSDRRPLPDFLIIGTKRGGTTSLWNYLIQHPLVPRLFPAWNTKSAHYFEEHWGRGEAWYRSHFPTERHREALQRRHGGPVRVGEAAPLYMFHPLAAQRVAALMPTVKLIVLLRDPVERAYSHWKERRTHGIEPLDFAAALAAEPERTAGERERLIAEPESFSEAYDWYTYRARGATWSTWSRGWSASTGRRSSSCPARTCTATPAPPTGAHSTSSACRHTTCRTSRSTTTGGPHRWIPRYAPS